MDVRLDDGPVFVTLSRRNILELLAELESDYPTAVLSRWCTQPSGDSVFLVVEAQENDAHYGDRKPGTLGMVNP